MVEYNILMAREGVLYIMRDSRMAWLLVGVVVGWSSVSLKREYSAAGAVERILTHADTENLFTPERVIIV